MDLRGGSPDRTPPKNRRGRSNATVSTEGEHRGGHRNGHRIGLWRPGPDTATDTGPESATVTQTQTHSFNRERRRAREVESSPREEGIGNPHRSSFSSRRRKLSPGASMMGPTPRPSTSRSSCFIAWYDEKGTRFAQLGRLVDQVVGALARSASRPRGPPRPRPSTSADPTSRSPRNSKPGGGAVRQGSIEAVAPAWLGAGHARPASARTRY